MARIHQILWVRRTGIITLDLLMVVLAWFGAYWLRFNFGAIPDAYLDRALGVAPYLVAIQAVLFRIFGVFRGVWRFTSLPDLIRIIKAVVAGTLLLTLLSFLLFRLAEVPRSVPFFYFLLLIGLMAGIRLAYRWLKEKSLAPILGKRVLLVGAGEAGELLARDLLRNPDSGYMPVAFVDDRARRHGKEVRGVPVVGAIEDIPGLVDKLEIDLILLALPSASTRQKRRAVNYCEQSGVKFQTLPNVEQLLTSGVSISDLREVSIEDILGRDPVSLDWQAIRSGLCGRKIMVTGAGGSIGSELCRQLARLEPSRLILLENSEYNLYRIEAELRKEFGDCQLDICLADVTDAPRIKQVFELYRPDVVFHAAAYKHVPLLEFQIREAVRNNVLGTRLVADCANRFGCHEFVLISTDKAVNPSSIMGTTKRLAEIYCQNLDARSQTRYVTVRFGNVLDSAGSVVPLFRRQIAAGGPVTVTHPDMERYFMTIPEACQLIMQASVIGAGGEIFVLNMGEPVKIRVLAEQMIRLSGKTPGEEIKIEYVGLRPGEKLYEELFHDDEHLQPTVHDEILLAQYRKVDWEQLDESVALLEQGCARLDEAALLKQLRKFVPESRLQVPTEGRLDHQPDAGEPLLS